MNKQILRTVTESFQVGPFDAWDEATQEKILDKNRGINIDHDWWDCDNLIYPGEEFLGDRAESFEQAMKEPSCKGLLFTYDRLFFELGRSGYIQPQNLEVVNEEAFFVALGVPPELHDFCDYRFVSDREFNTKVTIEFDMDLDEMCEMGLKEDTLCYLEQECEGRFDDLMVYTLSNLNQWYESLQGDDCVKETLIANEYDFTANGSIY